MTNKPGARAVSDSGYFFLLKRGIMNMNCNKNCQVCPNLVASTAVTVTASAMQITIPTMALNDNRRICLVIANNFASASPLPVQLVDGTSTIELLNRYGKPVYSDQLRTRKIYKLRINTAAPNAIVTSCNLFCTAAVSPQITGA